MPRPWEMPIEKVLEYLHTDPEEGLTVDEVQIRLSKYGSNTLEEEKPINVVNVLLRQFTSPLVILLIIAALISLVIGEVVDATLIVTIVIINGFVGFLQEYKAENALKMLKSMLKPRAKVIREGRIQVVEAEYLVPGDIILLEEGDRVPADARLIDSINLSVDESPLTGESVPVDKDHRWYGEGAVADRKNVVYAGTTVVRGRGRAVVYATGKNTEMGKIAKGVLGEGEERSLFDVEMARLSSMIGKITLIIAVLVILIYVVEGMNPVDAVSVGVALAVAAVPEGLPIVITLALSLGALEMSRKKALVRRIKSIEVLGSVNVICTDKTGTITKNKMSVVAVDGDERWIRIVASCCNNSDPASGTGDPMEIALKEYSGEMECERLAEIPFSSDRKMMTVVVRIDGRGYILTKGAPEKIAELTEDPEIIKRAERMAENGMRVIALAYKEDDGRPERPPYKTAGLVGLLDPPREGVREAVETAKMAGIKTIMITGDHAKTALAVARMVGIEGGVITGDELERMSDEDLMKVIDNVGVFARVDPAHKTRIVKALKSRGYVVAMTGDGVNDAPALKSADVGIALGSGTDVAKDVADMILLDNNYATIIGAIKEGRRIFDNIKKFVLYLLSANTGEVVGVFGASLLGYVLLKPAHLLLINLLTDGLPAIALATDPPASDIMRRPPRRKGDPILSRGDLYIGIGLLGLLIGMGMIAAFFEGLPDVKRAWSTVLLGFVLLEFVRLQSVRKGPVTSNKMLLISIAASLLLVLLLIYSPLSSILSLLPPSKEEVLGVLLISVVIYIITRLLHA